MVLSCCRIFPFDTLRAIRGALGMRARPPGTRKSSGARFASRAAVQVAASGLAAFQRADALDEIDCTAVNDKGLIRRHQAQWFEERLSKQQSVKWIGVIWRQLCYG